MNTRNITAILAVVMNISGCGGGGGTSTPATPPPPAVTTPAPTVTLALSQPKVSLGTSSTVTWSSTNATSCTASGAWSGTQAISGSSAQTPTSSGANTYTLTCTGAGGTANQTATLTVPIPVQKSSYLNAKNLNIPSQKIPTYPGLAGLDGYGEGATGGVAFGDFLQTGEISLVAFTNRWSTDATKPSPVGAVHFYKYVNGEPVEVTSALLKDTTGCVAPRRVLVADFNNDGKPDVFASCHGSEFGPYASWPGEAPRILLSQSDGTYTNIPAPINCYCHGASAGDVDGDGNIDIVASDANRSRDGKSSYILLRGDGKGKFVEVTGFIAPAADYVMFDKAYYQAAFDVELIDIDADGKFDLFLGGGELNTNPYILRGDGQGKFMSVHSKFALGTKDYHFTDALFANGHLYVYANLNSDQYKNQVRKYDLATGNYTVIYDGAVVHPSWNGLKHDFIFLMIYKGTLVPYDSRFNEAVTM